MRLSSLPISWRRLSLAGALGLLTLALALPVAAPALAAPPGISGLASPSHPVAANWYANRNPSFSWRGLIARPTIAGYSYVLDGDPGTVPDTIIDLAAVAFSPRRDVLVDADASGVVARDFNRDGKADLLVATNPGRQYKVIVLLGRGDGTFAAPHSYNLGTNACGLVIGDVNGDHRLDIVSSADGQVTVLLGRGNGTFAALHGDGKPDASGFVPAALGDLNGDHRLDIVGSSGDQVGVLLGRGDGTFAAPHGSVADSDGNVRTLALGDLNGDGRTDVVAGSMEGVNQPDGSLSVLLGKGNGSFRAAVTHGTDILLPTDLAVTDVNHDGKPDLLVGDNADGVDYGTDSYGAIVVFLGKGNGTFSPGHQYVVGQGQLVPALKVADFNRDGNADLLVATTAGLAVLLGNGDGTFQAPVQFDTTYEGAPPAVGDFNRDGKPDLAVDAEGTTVSVFLNRSTAAAYHGLADGLWYFHVRAVDTTGAGGPTATRAVRIDTQRPSTKAPYPVILRHNATARRLTYQVNDPPPCAGWCNVVIEVKNGHGTVLLRKSYAHARSGVWYHPTFLCALTRGSYRFYVYAKDAAGNPSQVVGWNNLIVK